VFSDTLGPIEWRFQSPKGRISVKVRGRLCVNNLDAGYLILRHPSGHEKRGAILRSKVQVATSVMDLLGDHYRGLPGKRLVRIEDLNLAPQTPGIMTSRRMPAVAAPPLCTR